MIGKVENICSNNNENVFIIRFFNNIKPIFDKPINSMKLHIGIVNNLSQELKYVNINNINLKYNYHYSRYKALIGTAAVLIERVAL
jgi:hypothetical protein